MKNRVPLGERIKRIFVRLLQEHQAERGKLGNDASWIEVQPSSVQKAQPSEAVESYPIKKETKTTTKGRASVSGSRGKVREMKEGGEKIKRPPFERQLRNPPIQKQKKSSLSTPRADGERACQSCTESQAVFGLQYGTPLGSTPGEGGFADHKSDRRWGFGKDYSAKRRGPNQSIPLERRNTGSAPQEETLFKRGREEELFYNPSNVGGQRLERGNRGRP